MSGIVRMRTMALWQALSKASSMGNVPACTSSRSVGEVLRVPVIARVAILCIFCSLCKVFTDLMFFVYLTGLLGGGCTRC